MTHSLTAEEMKDLEARNKRTALRVFAFVGFMVGMAYASVPLYDLFCRVTGFGGTTQTSEALPGEVLDRQVTVRFNADTNRNLSWDFGPEANAIEVNLGQQGLIAYKAENTGRAPSAGTAVYNVTPPKVGKYFSKIQCFCFDRQVLQPGEEVDMPVMFYVDPALHDDPYMDDVQTITLSYTFFPADSDELDAALEDYYDSP